jgi:hypothetical protein
MRRREFIAGLASMLVLPLGASGQQTLPVIEKLEPLYFAPRWRSKIEH